MNNTKNPPKKDAFGINMKKFCKEHEAYMLRCLEACGEPKETAASASLSENAGKKAPYAALLKLHLERIRWVQHERLIHLIVTLLTALAELFALDLVLLHPETHPWDALFMLGLAVLLMFYFAHYFFLENTVQRWYKIAEVLQEQAEPIEF